MSTYGTQDSSLKRKKKAQEGRSRVRLSGKDGALAAGFPAECSFPGGQKARWVGTRAMAQLSPSPAASPAPRVSTKFCRTDVCTSGLLAVLVSGVQTLKGEKKCEPHASPVSLFGRPHAWRGLLPLRVFPSIPRARSARPRRRCARRFTPAVPPGPGPRVPSPTLLGLRAQGDTGTHEAAIPAGPVGPTGGRCTREKGTRPTPGLRASPGTHHPIYSQFQPPAP